MHPVQRFGMKIVPSPSCAGSEVVMLCSVYCRGESFRLER